MQKTKQHNPLVSVIVPNYNHAQFLVQRLNSIINQTYKNTELIVLDDCSTDNSIETLKKYKKYISVLEINTSNTGSPFKQWQKGISLAKGEWIWIAESDDYCELTLLKTLIENANKYPNIVLSYCKTQAVDTNNKPTTIPQFKEKNKYFKNKDFIKKRLLTTCDILNAGAAIFKKNTAKNISKEYTNYRCCGDKRFWTEIALQGNIAISSECLNYFRSHTNNTSKLKKLSTDYFLEDKLTYDYVISKDIIKKGSMLDFLAKAVYNKAIDKDKLYDLETSQKLHQIWEYKKTMSIIPWYYGDLHAQGPLRYAQTLIKYYNFTKKTK